MLVKYKVYQTPVTTPYCFIPYELCKGKVKLDDYTLVAEGEEWKYDNINITLENIFAEGNNGHIQQDYALSDMRSTSISDIIEIENKYYYVNDFGFKEIEL